MATAATGNRRGAARRGTSHLKLVPQSLDLRESLRERCRQLAGRLDKSRPLGKDEMERLARELLAEAGEPEGYVGWTMVVLASEFWRDQVAAVPPSRRLFLLPHCLKHAEGCPADYDEFGLNCKECGACSIADFRGMAEEMGYRVLVAEGSPVVLKVIVSGYVDAIVGVACLNVLEKAIDKILLAGIPCMAVPLLSSDCRNTSVDEPWVRDILQVEATSDVVKTESYLPVMRLAAGLFEADRLEQLVPRLRGGPRLSQVPEGGLQGLDPVATTEAIAYDFLTKGGKYSRPFIALAVYDALTGGKLGSGDETEQDVSESVLRAAMSIEAFHKASLVHDDIQDDDLYRYGEPSLHHRFGGATAINVGDYLIGMGYRLVGGETAALGAAVTADVLSLLADAHMRLSEGQGAELAWRDVHDKRLKPIDALKVYVLKTAPAFEAALLTGARLAGPIDDLRDPLKKFARNLGVGFQILNDLQDWRADDFNKCAVGTDLLGGRPTLLWALACDSLSASDSDELLSLATADSQSEAVRVERARQLFLKADVFARALQLVDKHRIRALAAIDELENERLRHLLQYLLDTVWDRPDESEFETRPAVIPLTLPR